MSLLVALVVGLLGWKSAPSEIGTWAASLFIARLGLRSIAWLVLGLGLVFCLFALLLVCKMI